LWVLPGGAQSREPARHNLFVLEWGRMENENWIVIDPERIFNRDRDRVFKMKNADRFYRKKRGAIFTKKTRSVCEMLITCAHVHRRTPRRQPYLRTGFFIAIRFSKKIEGRFFLEKTRID